MNRDELLAVCFGRDDLPAGAKIFETLAEPDRRDVLSHVDLSYQQVMVWLRHDVGPGPGVQSATETFRVAAISNVCTHPDHRSRGYASANVRAAHTEAATHASVRFAALFAGPDLESFYERLGYRRVEEAPEGGFMVCSLDGSPWPPGRVDTRGVW